MYLLAQGQQRQDIEPRIEQAKTVEHSWLKFKFDYVVTRLLLIYIVKKCYTYSKVHTLFLTKTNGILRRLLHSKLLMFVKRLHNYRTVHF